MILLLLTAGCQIRRPPVVEILMPKEGQQFSVGETVTVNAKLTDDDQVGSEYLTVLSGNNYSDTILYYVDHTHIGSYMLLKDFQVRSAGSIKIIVTAWDGYKLVEQSVFVQGY
ncbi:MAG: hypothetical protein JST82_00955 [Bacteroidetes bacterium]|nr:hypothetical protein [Bacteroidota bacterium]